VPTGQHGVSDEREYPKLSSRGPAEANSSEDQLDNATNGTASNEDSSSDETSRQSPDATQTRMADESEEEEDSPPVKVCCSV
jgi:ubiquitin carboxyl-terminal hydrolase 4/11